MRWYLVSGTGYWFRKEIAIILALFPLETRKCSRVPRFRFASDGIFDTVQRSGLGTRTKLKTRSLRKKCWFCHIIAKYHVPDPPASPVMYGTGISQEVGNGGQVCGDVKAVGFLVQNVYKMTYCDENATLNL